MRTFNPLAPRRFGVEIEVSRRLTCVNNSDRQYSRPWLEISDALSTLMANRRIGSWRVVTDISCGGEVVSPILAGMNGLKEVAIVCDRIKQIAKKYGLPAVDGECGLHIHIDVGDLQPRHLSNLSVLVHLAEPIIYAMYPNRNHEYCAPIDMNMRLASKWDDWIDVRDTWYRSSNNVKDKDKRYSENFINSLQPGDRYDGTRYHGFNIHCYWRQHTVEFRYAAGTLDPLHIRAYYEMCLAMVNTAASSKKIRVDELFLNMKYHQLRAHYQHSYRFRRMIVDVAKRCNFSRSTVKLIMTLIRRNSPFLLMKDPARFGLTINENNKSFFWYLDEERGDYYDDNGTKISMTLDRLSKRGVISVRLVRMGDKYYLDSLNDNIKMNVKILVDPRQKAKPPLATIPTGWETILNSIATTNIE